MAVTRLRSTIQANQRFDDQRFRIIVAGIMNGRQNNIGEITLTANAATTTVTDTLINENSVITLMPMTANAAGAIATTYFDAPTQGSVVINHANNAQADKTFRYEVTG